MALDSNAARQLVGFVKRIEAIRAEIAERQGDIAAIRKEARGSGGA